MYVLKCECMTRKTLKSEFFLSFLHMKTIFVVFKTIVNHGQFVGQRSCRDHRERLQQVQTDVDQER